MGYSLNRSRPSRISPTGTADTSIFSVKFTSLGWEQPRVWYPAKLWTEGDLQAKETEFAGGKACPCRERFRTPAGFRPPPSQPSGSRDAWMQVQDLPACLPPCPLAPVQELTLN